MPALWTTVASRHVATPHSLGHFPIKPTLTSCKRAFSAKLRPKEPSYPTYQEEVAPTPRRVVFRNRSVIVLNKPPGVATQGEEGSEAFTRWTNLFDQCKEEYGDLFPVHRLDKSTSGCLVLARTPSVARTLTNAFKAGQIYKTYIALVQFKSNATSALVRGDNVGTLSCRMRNRSDKMVLCEANRSDPECKESTTDYEVITASTSHALLRLKPRTGRKHQLRLHCARLLNAPIVGDYKYGFEYLDDVSRRHIDKFLKRDADARIMLHAESMHFPLFQKEEPRRYTVTAAAPIPEDLSILCSQMDIDTSQVEPDE